MKLIVTDMDGTLLNSKREISPDNVSALLSAQKKGLEIAIATGRTYGNARALCLSVGLEPHIISNHGAFVYTKHGEKIVDVGIQQEHVRNALSWLVRNNYYYNVCTDTHSFMPAGGERVLVNDYKAAECVIPGVNEKWVNDLIQYLSRSSEARSVINTIDEVVETNLKVGSIVAITFDQNKLNAGRAYFEKYQGLSMTVAGNNVFEMIHTSVSKGNALEQLTQYLNIPMNQVLAIGDNYNDISMLERVGVSVAIGNAEEAVKKVCKYVSLSNDLDGVAYCIRQFVV